MNVQTSRFGEIEVSEDLLFHLTDPILGYESESQFVLIEHKAKSNFKWLQSIQTPSLAFAVTIPGFFGIEYSFELPENIQEELEIEANEDILALNIVLIPHENPRNATINLLAPLIFNVKTRKGAQVILTGSNFSVNHPLIEENEKEAVC